ncbi:hypothetical protein DERF_008948 [Dermatophagoides farinae]|uniref:Uncharacterized protein n=1 Tax=Dermatophagoides farinae TaxID=6954 RepID=A0A922L062_DERFA|nr:hypothetical protein DERF_008948 [Dermatophagoides farinae]
MDIKIFENGTYGLNSLMSSCKVRAMEIHSGNWTLITSYWSVKIKGNTSTIQEKSELRFKRNQLNNESKTRTSNATNASSLIHLYLLAIAISLIIFFLEQLHYILNRKNKK